MQNIIFLKNARRVIELLRKYESKEITLTLQNFTIDLHTLLSLKPMEELIILKV